MSLKQSVCCPHLGRLTTETEISLTIQATSLTSLAQNGTNRSAPVGPLSYTHRGRHGEIISSGFRKHPVIKAASSQLRKRQKAEDQQRQGKYRKYLITDCETAASKGREETCEIFLDISCRSDHIDLKKFFNNNIQALKTFLLSGKLLTYFLIVKVTQEFGVT